MYTLNEYEYTGMDTWIWIHVRPGTLLSQLKDCVNGWMTFAQSHISEKQRWLVLHRFIAYQ